MTIKKIDDYESIYSVHPLYLLINHANRYIEENKEILKKYNEIWEGIKNKVKAINANSENDYWKDYVKIKLNSGDDLPLNEPLKFHAMTIIIRSVFE